ncbi:MAG: hypothetical protein AAB733_00890 [Patescibacteria group bacterium]
MPKVLPVRQLPSGFRMTIAYHPESKDQHGDRSWVYAETKTAAWSGGLFVMNVVNDS